METSIRSERPEDAAAIATIHERAFGQPAEARLVAALRAAGALAVSLVGEREGRLVGHVAFSPVSVRDGPGPAWEAIGLGPVGVLPDQQRTGVGAALVRAGLAACRARRQLVVLVLGHASYYPRFGFRPAAPEGLRWEHGHDESFFVLELAPGALAGRRGVVRYRPEFAAI
jgi:putative acetyltransferase